MSGRALVIGYGSTLRRDDAAGVLVADAVAAWDLPGVDARAVAQLVPELAAPLAAADLAIFVDARAAGAGESIEVRPIGPEAERISGTPLGHAADPRGLLALAELAFGRRPGTAWLVTVPAPDLDLGEGLSPTAARGVAEALAAVARLLGREPSPCTR